MKKIALALLTMVLLLHRSAAGQNAAEADSGAVVTGNGSVVVKEMPTTMRVSIHFKETGKDLAEALKSLKDRRAAAGAQFVKLGASKDSIRDGSPGLAGDDPQSARQMAMMMHSRGGNKKKKSTSAAKVTVTGSVSAEWPLPSGGIEELLLFVQPLKDKLNAADLAGQKEKKKLSAEELEEQEELEILQQQMGDLSDGAKTGEPKFVFFAKIPLADQTKHRAAAFQKARQQAEQLVAASGRKLGKLRGLSSHSDTTDHYRYMQFEYGGNGQVVDDSDTPDHEDESIITSPVCGKIRHAFSIAATFEIQ